VRFYWLIVGVLVVWRLTHLLVAEDGPWDVIVRVRRAAGEGMLARLLDCFFCLSLWIALPVAAAIGGDGFERIMLWPALSAGAMIVERTTERRSTATATYFEEPEEHDDMLRTTEKRVLPDSDPTSR
jgi:hypothetical protein